MSSCVTARLTTPRLNCSPLGRRPYRRPNFGYAERCFVSFLLFFVFFVVKLTSYPFAGIIFLISAIALAGFNPFGQTWAQFMMVWQR